MREIRQSGSEGGATQHNAPSLPLSENGIFRLFTRPSKIVSLDIVSEFEAGDSPGGWGLPARRGQFRYSGFHMQRDPVSVPRVLFPHPSS